MRLLPDSHTDFVFGIGVDASGIVILCLALLALSAFLVIWMRRRRG